MAQVAGPTGRGERAAPRTRRRELALIAAGVLAVVVLAVVLILALRESPGAALARAVDTTIGEGSAEATVTGTVRDVPLVGDMTVSVAEGVLDMTEERASLRRELPLVSGLDLPMVGSVGDVELLYADGGAWLRGPLDTERSWVRLRDAQDEAAATAPGLGNPLALLAIVRAIEGTPEEVDDERLDGVDTTRYRVLVDLDALDGELGAGSRRLLESLRTLHEDGRLPMEVWVDDDSLIRRVLYEVDADLPGLPELRLATRVDLDGHGLPVTIEPPGDDEVVDVSADRLRDLGLLQLLREWFDRLPFVGD